MVNIIAINEYHLDKIGIYRIWFGSKFYIGSTIDSYKRMVGHTNAILGAFNGIGIGKNSITNIFNHLVANSHINTGFFELLEECNTELDLVDAEHDWLCNFEGNANCLNHNFSVHRTISGIIVRPNGSFTIKQPNKYALV